MQSVEVSLVSNPILEIQGSKTFCVGGSSVLSVEGEYASYLWSDNSTTPTIEVYEAGTYSVTVTNDLGCSSVEEVGVSVTDIEVPAVEGEILICENEKRVLSILGDYELYLWSEGSTTSSIEAEAGTYSVTVQDENGCNASTSIVVELAESPVVEISGSETFCEGSRTVLSVEGEYVSYLWSNGATTSTIEVSEGGNYSVTVTNALGCSGTEEKSILANSPETPTIEGETAVCEDETTVIFVMPENYESYLWSNDLTTSSIEVGAGAYSVTVLDSNGCSALANITVESMESPLVEILGSETFCEGSSTILSVGGQYESYLWSNEEETSDIEVSVGDTYSVTVFDALGCSGTGEITVSVSNELQPTVGGNPSFCGGENTTLSVGNFDSYLWSSGDIGNQITVEEPGVYSVTVTDDFDCSGVESVEVSMFSLPEFVIFGELEFCEGSSTILSVEEDFVSYLWSEGSTTSAIEVEEQGTYSVTVTNVLGCSAVEEVGVLVNAIEVPVIEGETTICEGEKNGSDCFGRLRILFVVRRFDNFGYRNRRTRHILGDRYE